MNAMPYKHVAVLMGGPSAERAVSLNSGRAVAQALRECGYQVDEVDANPDGLPLPDGVEAVFIALHGTYGEDGQVQLALRERGIPYTGANVESSRLAFDKLASKRRFIEAGIPTPEYEVCSASSARTLPCPVVVKPVHQGSSIGIHRVFDEADWVAAFHDACQYDESILVERFIPGKELTVGIVGDDVFPVLEIRAPDGYYDYRAKYTSGATQYLVPAPIPDDRAEACRDLAWRAFTALDAFGLSRVDFRMTDEGDLYILEINTIPGFTATSLLPKSAAAAGVPFPELCDRIMRMARVH